MVSQPGGPGTFEVPAWDPESQQKVRSALLALNETVPDLRWAAGRRGEVDPVRHLIVTASGWGANPNKDAVYLNVTPVENDGRTAYRLRVPGDVPVDGFWSVSVHDADGLFRKNDLDAYAINNITAARDDDGAVTVNFGGASDDVPNFLPIFEGWNYLVRLYRPRTEIHDGGYRFPEAQPVR